MRTLVEDYDIVVVGAGHAGCEAALAGARLGLNTVMFTVSVDSEISIGIDRAESEGYFLSEGQEGGTKNN